MLDNFRLAVRSLAKARGFALTAIVTLALGIGANTVIFSLAHGVLLKPLPFSAPGQLVSVKATKRSEGVAGRVHSHSIGGRFSTLLLTRR